MNPLPTLPDGMYWEVRRENGWNPRIGRHIVIELRVDADADALLSRKFLDTIPTSAAHLGKLVREEAWGIWCEWNQRRNISDWLEEKPWLD
ncbi:hypothetical protein SEA_ESTES_11 [Mycobacterium phage Estes]|uniref:Uncharacterized protein n=1 Tax=Mycobacterium phage Estes TaxID=2759459 RepID=A0A7G9A281_9CAUD|nr:hypothetical protein J4U03_gp011 [Mycobacterium phage Estes]QNL30720.1 hypothetical protein SEA_ESTES_11 [Mycobacterium phage Estes]